MSNSVNKEVESIDIQVEVIDQAIIDLKSVVDNLSGEKGVKLIAEAGKLVEDNLSGEFEIAIAYVSKERELCYKDAIFNIEVMVLVLKVYREYLRNGPNGKLVENKQHIEMAPKDMDKQILDLEFSISDVRPKLFNTSYVDGYVRSRRSYLESEIRRKESHQPEPLDASRERYLLSVLNHNEKEHGVAIDNIENGISAITVLNSEIEDEIGVLKKEFDDYYKLWDVHENKGVKIVTYNNINYTIEEFTRVKLEEAFKNGDKELILGYLIYILEKNSSLWDKHHGIDHLVSSILASVTYSKEHHPQGELLGRLFEFTRDGELTMDDIINNWDLTDLEKDFLEELRTELKDMKKDPLDYIHMFQVLATLINSGELAEFGTNGQAEDAGGWLLDFIKDYDNIKYPEGVQLKDLNADYMALKMKQYLDEGYNYIDAFSKAEEDVLSNQIDGSGYSSDDMDGPEKEFFDRVISEGLMTEEEILNSYTLYAESLANKGAEALGKDDFTISENSKLEGFMESYFDVSISNNYYPPLNSTGKGKFTWDWSYND